MNSRIARRRVAAVDRSVKTVCEQLEGRTMLSTINWTNRVVSDNFGIYGANTATARAIVDRAIADWERVIVNFNYAGGGNTYNVDISAGAISGRGVTNNITRDNAVDRLPTSADITLDDNGGGGGWYFDTVVGSSTVPDDGEFNTNLTPFEGDAGNVGNDFYRTIVHELGHAMGILDSSGFLKIGDFLTNGGADPNNGAETLRLLNFNGGAVDYTLTTDGGGHMFEGGGAYAGPIHPNDLMNDGRTVATGDTIRQLISDDNATLLRDVYGYTIALPSTINTFYVNLNTSTNVITVNGDINDNGSDVDAIDLELTGTNAGDFRGEVNGASEIVPDAQYTSIVVNAGEANDDIDVDELESGKTVTVNGGNANDNINVAQEFDDIDTNLGSNVVVNGGAGTDTIVLSDGADSAGGDDYTINQSTFVKNASFINRIVTYNTMEQFTLTGGPNAGVYNINSTFSTTNYNITGGALNDDFNFGTGDGFTGVDADVVINGGAGTDSLTANDSARAVASTYTVGTGSMNRTGALGSLVFSAIEDATLNTGTLGDTVNVTGTATGVTLRVNTGNGADSVTLLDDLDTDFSGTFIGNGGAGTDSITLDDTGDPLDDTYTITGTSLQKAPLSINVSYLAFEDISLLANTGNNTINFTNPSSGQTMRLLGGTGDDTFVNTIQDINTQILGPVFITGGVGTADAVTLNDSGDLTATAYTLDNNSFQVTAGVLSGVISYGTIESFTVTTNDLATPININSALSTVNYTINGADGNDTFNFGAGDFDNNIDSTVGVNGGAGVDRVVIDDTLDTVDDTYEVNAGSFAKNTGTGAVSWSGLLIGNVTIEQFVLNASEANNTINVNGLGGFILQPFPNPAIDVPIDATLNGNGGNDNFITSPTSNLLGSIRGDLVVTGGAGTDSITVNDDADTTADTFTLTSTTLANSNWNYGLTYGTLESFVADGGTGGNIFTVNSTNGLVTYRLNGNNGTDVFDIVGDNTPVIIDGGAGLDTVNINNDAVGTALARFANNQDLQSLNIFIGGTLTLDAGDHVIDTVGATFAGRLNLNDGAFIDRAPANQATYRTLLTTGYAGGLWNTAAQPAIFSLTANGGIAGDGLGYAFGSEMDTASVFGVPVNAGDHVVRYTLYGDSTLNGTVNIDDFGRLAANFNTPSNWARGNYNYDANTDIDDFGLLAANFNQVAPASAGRTIEPTQPAAGGSVFSQEPIEEEVDPILAEIA